MEWERTECGLMVMDRGGEVGWRRLMEDVDSGWPEGDGAADADPTEGAECDSGDSGAFSGCGEEVGEQKGVRGYRCGVSGDRESPDASFPGRRLRRPPLSAAMADSVDGECDGEDRREDDDE